MGWCLRSAVVLGVCSDSINEGLRIDFQGGPNLRVGRWDESESRVGLETGPSFRSTLVPEDVLY